MIHTANESLQLLWIHHHEPQYELRLSALDVVTLEFIVLNKYEELTTPYKTRMIPQTKEELADFLLINSSKTIFTEGK